MGMSPLRMILGIGKKTLGDQIYKIDLDDTEKTLAWYDMCHNWALKMSHSPQFREHLQYRIFPKKAGDMNTVCILGSRL